MTVAAAAPVSARQWDAWSSKTFPPVEEFRPGVWSIPVPIPNHPVRFTYCYALVAPEGVLVIDPGWESEQGWEALIAGLGVAGADASRVVGVVATHFHADHLGLARRLLRESGAWLGLGASERTHVPGDDYAESVREKFRVWGVPEEVAPAVLPDADALRTLAGLASADRWLADGEVVDWGGGRLRVVHTPGHSPGHICLVDDHRRLVFTGDHVLPRITPHVSYDPAGLENPIGDYLSSLERISLSAEYEACAAHEYRFGFLAERCDVLRERTVERSAEVREALADPSCDTVWSVARRLTWSRGWPALSGISMRLALAETAAHIKYLREAGIASSIPLTAGPDAGSRAS